MMQHARGQLQQVVLGHESGKMARHHADEARTFAAVNLITKYSLAGLDQPVQVDHPAAKSLMVLCPEI
jgi:hypothetical protein